MDDCIRGRERGAALRAAMASAAVHGGGPGAGEEGRSRSRAGGACGVYVVRWALGSGGLWVEGMYGWGRGGSRST